MSGWILLLPPSESKANPPAKGIIYSEAVGSRKLNSFPELDPFREKVLSALDKALHRGSGLEELFEVTGASLAETIALNSALRKSPTLPARELYTGVMYLAVDFPALSASQRKLFDKNVLIISALYGAVRPTDAIAPYKLKIAANLGGAVGKIVHFWKRPVSEIIRREVRGKVVWDFLPDQHKRVWDGTGEVSARHEVKFVKKVVRSGIAEYKTISHHSKELKGALIRHLLARNAMSPKDLYDFHHPEGYRYNHELSYENKEGSQLVFAAD